MHTCQLSRFSRESPSFSSNLPVSRLEHQISRIKWTFEYFCALVWNLVHFFTKFELFLFIVQFLGHFCTCLVNEVSSSLQWWKRILIPCTSCNTSYNVLRQFVGAGGGGGVGGVDIRGWGGGVVQNRESPDFRSPEVGRYAYVTEAVFCWELVVSEHSWSSVYTCVWRKRQAESYTQG